MKVFVVLLSIQLKNPAIISPHIHCLQGMSLLLCKDQNSTSVAPSDGGLVVVVA